MPATTSKRLKGLNALWGHKRKDMKMLKNFKMAALAAVVTLTGMGYSAAPSMAQGVEFLIGPDGVRVRSSDYCERNRWDSRRCGDYFDRRRDRRDDDRYERRRDRRADDRYERRRCDTDDAVRKARDMGVRRARVVDAGRRTVEVAGFGNRGPVKFTFGRERGCPVLDRQRY